MQGELAREARSGEHRVAPTPAGVTEVVRLHGRTAGPLAEVLS